MVFNVNDQHLKIKKEFPSKVREIRHVWIPMRDGCKLAARIWLPEDAESQPVPGLLEYIPYRKNDFTALRDSIRHRYFAGHGYASVRVDMRGSGDSEGILYDEYLPQEQEDAEDVLTWMSAQPWCTGSIGMFGKSWGGFNSLQVAARQHPNLKAIITLCSTDDRYADDVHYMGGNVLASDMQWWASTMLVYNARPADLEVVGDKWREMWLDRLDKTPPFIEEWLSHQRRDDYWKQGSVCEDYDSIKIPVFAVGGWADGYTNAIFRLLENLKGPKLGLVGPWSHEYPEVATPGPNIGFLQEALRWWDKWLKGIETDILEEAQLRVWVQDALPPSVNYQSREGYFAALESWPSEQTTTESLYLQQGTLAKHVTPSKLQRVESEQMHGLHSGVWCPFGQAGDLPSDQRLELPFSHAYVGEELQEPLEILGFPIAKLRVASDQPLAMVAVRLSDRAPSGETTLISWGMLNLTHHSSHEFPETLVPGHFYDVDVQLNAIGYRLPAGHQIEVAVSPNYWPHAWPSPEEVTLTLDEAACRIELPLRTARSAEDDAISFEAPETAAVLDREIVRPEKRKRMISFDPVTDTWILRDYSDEGARLLPDSGLEYGSENTNVFSIKKGDPLSAQTTSTWSLHIGRGDWQTRVESCSKMTCDEEHYFVYNQLSAFEGDTQVFSREWKKEIKRDHT